MGALVLYRALVSGALSLDTGIGRRVRPLGPLSIDIGAPREVVFDVIAAPYVRNAGREAGDHIEVLERGSDMVVAAHFTPVAGGMVATTVEAVGFHRPDEFTFRLLRGPVPHVHERFVLEDRGGTTTLRYDGELGTDFGPVGEQWGNLVARSWVRAVEQSFADVRDRSERLAVAHRRRGGGAQQ